MHSSALPPLPLRRLPRAIAVVALVGASMVLTAYTSRPAFAGAHDFADPIFSADARGDILTIGNVTTTCDPGYTNANWSAAESRAACLGATSGATGLKRYDGAAMPPINNRLSMRFVDVDRNASTFDSSTAQLHLPAGSTVLWAGLHWNAATDVPPAAQLYGSTYEVAPVNAAKRFTVRLATPRSGGYVALDATSADGVHRDRWDDTNPGGTSSYGGYVDVTDLVRAGGSGAYTAADVQSCRGFGGCFGSWSLTVAVANASMPPRNLNVWHGWELTTPTVNRGAQEFTVNGITPPPAGPVQARIGVVQADGDRGLGPDSLDISSPSAPTWTRFAAADRPLAPGETDWFNSTVNGYGHQRSNADASPNLRANLDQDIALVQDHRVIANSDRSFSFRVQTAGTESLYSQVVHSAVDLYAPQIAIDKTVAPTGPAHRGDQVTWTLAMANAGIDPIRHAVVTDPLPTGLTYVPGSVRFTTGGPAAILGAKTDAPGDDQFDWDGARRRLVLRIGSGANATSGGTMGIAPAADGSDHVTVTFRTTVAVDPGATITNVASAIGEGRALDDPFGPLTTQAHDPASIAAQPEADLGITKSDGEAVVRAVGDRFTYQLAATNAGPSSATGVTMTDDLDPMIRFVDSSDGCAASGRRVTCVVGSLAKGEAARRTFVVEVVSLPGPGKEIDNLATIDGNEPNPDCTGATPHALCNHDTEQTPQPSIDLGITKTDGDAVVARVGDTYRYRLEVTDAGPDDATGVTIDDDLSPLITFAGSARCLAHGQHVTCALGDLAAGATRSVELTVRVVKLPPVGRSIPNTATVAAIEPDPDCTPATPDARCNHDDEHTPRTTPTRAIAPTTTTSPTTAPPAAPTPPTPTSRRPHAPLVRTGSSLGGALAVGIIAIASGATVLAGRRRQLQR